MLHANTRSLLIVEDEAELRKVLAESLSPLGVDIVLAEDGKAALEILKVREFDTVLCDISMPRMTGLELLEEAARLSLPSVFIMLTGYSDQSKILEALRLGALDYLEKPFEVEELIATVRRALEIGTRRLRIDQAVKADPELRREVGEAERLKGLFQVQNNRERRKKSA